MKYTILIMLGLFLTIQLWSQQKSESGIRHAIVISGPKTFEINEKDEIVWEYEGNSRDMSKLENGNYLITYSNKVIEITPAKKIIWTYVSAVNPEFMSAQRLDKGKTLVTELGEQPRLVEVDSEGIVTREIPINPESYNTHMQSRMEKIRKW